MATGVDDGIDVAGRHGRVQPNPGRRGRIRLESNQTRKEEKMLLIIRNFFVEGKESN
jgi:hypothetical protein